MTVTIKDVKHIEQGKHYHLREVKGNLSVETGPSNQTPFASPKHTAKYVRTKQARIIQVLYVKLRPFSKIEPLLYYVVRNKVTVTQLHRRGWAGKKI